MIATSSLFEQPVLNLNIQQLKRYVWWEIKGVVVVFFISSLFCKSKCQERVWLKLWRWLLNTSSSTIQRYRILTVYLFVLSSRWASRVSARNSIGSISTAPSKLFKIFYLFARSCSWPGRVFDPGPPSYIEHCLSRIFFSWRTFILKVALKK